MTCQSKNVKKNFWFTFDKDLIPILTVLPVSYNVANHKNLDTNLTGMPVPNDKVASM